MDKYPPKLVSTHMPTWGMTPPFDLIDDFIISFNSHAYVRHDVRPMGYARYIDVFQLTCLREA